MSDKIDDGGQAFPSHPALYSSADQAEAQGMSLRDWFAGQALAGMMANQRLLYLLVPKNMSQNEADELVARQAYASADAMIAARKGGAA